MKVISEYSRERLNTRRKAGSKAWLKARDRALSMIEVFSRPGAQRQAASGLPPRPCAAKRGRVATGLREISLAARSRSEERRVGKEGDRTRRSRWSPYPLTKQHQPATLVISTI